MKTATNELEIVTTENQTVNEEKPSALQKKREL